MFRKWFSSLLIVTLVRFEGKGSSQYCPITAFHHLKNLDNDVHMKTQSFFQKIKERISIFGLTIPFVDLKLAGSSEEGCSSSRYFQHDNDFSDNIHRMFEIDLEITLLKISDQYKDCFEDIKEKTGFVRIRVVDREKCIPSEVRDMYLTFDTVHSIHNFTTQQGYVNSYKVKEAYKVDMGFRRNHKYSHTTELLAAFLTNQPLHKMRTSNSISEVSKAVTTFSWNVFVNEELQWKVSSDFAMVIQLDWAPPILEEYKLRSRKWPPMKELEKEMRTTYVIAKPSNEERHNPNSTEFRYSFAILERKLVSLQSEHQRKIYLIFKSIIYKWIKPINPSKISSFIAKNIMLWTCEQKSPEDSLWEEDKDSIIKALKYLFGQLHEMFKVRFMPYIFIPEINVLEHLSKDTLKTVSTIAKEMSSNPLHFMPFGETEKVVEVLQKVLDGIHFIEDLAEDVATTGPAFLLLQRPDLFYESKYLTQYYKNFLHNAQSTTFYYKNFRGENIFPTERYPKTTFQFPWHLKKDNSIFTQFFL